MVPKYLYQKYCLELILSILTELFKIAQLIFVLILRVFLYFSFEK